MGEFGRDVILRDAEAEAGVVATLMYHPEFILHSDYLRESYFYNKENGAIYWAVKELFKSGIDTIDAINLTAMINSNNAVKRLMQRNNMENMQEFIDISKYASRETLEEYTLLAQSVTTMAFKRELQALSCRINNMCISEQFGVDELNEAVNGGINKLMEKYVIQEDVELFGEKIDELWQEIVDRRTDDGMYGIQSKFKCFGEYFTYENGEVVLLKARMKKGKSIFFMEEAIDKVENGIPTLYID